jgi:hypothetical protein
MRPFVPRAYAFRATGARLLTAGEHNFAIGFRGLATDPGSHLVILRWLDAALEG